VGLMLLGAWLWFRPSRHGGTAPAPSQPGHVAV
jgi:hypothetical protein